MEIVTPGLGLIFWTALLFLTVLIVLSKTAFKPIAKALKSREESIEKALKAADSAKEEVSALKSEIVDMKKAARAERAEILKEAKASGAKIMAEAQEKAKAEGAKIIAAAHESIRSEKDAALADIRRQVATLSVQIAEKLIERDLENKGAQERLLDQLLDKAISA